MMNIPKSFLEAGGEIFKLLPEKLQASGSYSQINQAKYIGENFPIFQHIQGLKPIDYNFLGMDLGDTPKWNFLWSTDWSNVEIWLPGLLLFLLPIVSGIVSYFSAKVSMKANPTAGGQQQSTNSMMLLMPLISVFFAFSMPGAIGVYIIVSTALAMIQDIILTKHYTKIMDAEDAVRNEQRRVREAELEAKRLETERKKLENKTEANPNTSKKKQQKSERQEQQEKAAEWEKKQSKEADAGDTNPSQSGTRRFARGRAYDPERFNESGEESAEGSGSEPEQGLASGVSEKEEQADYDLNESSITVEGDGRDVEID